ncbi:ABC transporter ATP-binding protein [Bengtsoniella intestinalis]|uniref:ABC transporter ATP-binding protein n=1 Tax=Bengtsoniella intestinalis TaxID=3073143 RepID=UPI00391FCA15
MFSVDNLSVSYLDQAVLKNFTLKMNQGEIVALVGESGSGKSTAIRAMFSLLSHEGRIDSGSVCLDGESLLDKTAEQWRDIRGKKIAMIFQDSGAMLNPIAKIKGQFVEYIRIHSSMTKAEAVAKAKEMLLSTNLQDPDRVMDSFPFQLSGGMRQRVGVAMAMTFNPKVLLADEPTSALDATTQKLIVDEMMELRDKHQMSIVIVTHNLGVAVHMADRIFVMQNGEVVEQGTSYDIVHNPQHPYTKQLLDTVPELEATDRWHC